MSTKIALTVEEATAFVGMGRTYLFREIREGRLVARKAGRRTIITRADLEKWLASLPPRYHLSKSDDGTQAA
jgi:excisionase family DNA binding protein